MDAAESMMAAALLRIRSDSARGQHHPSIANLGPDASAMTRASFRLQDTMGVQSSLRFSSSSANNPGLTSGMSPALNSCNNRSPRVGAASFLPLQHPPCPSHRFSRLDHPLLRGTEESMSYVAPSRPTATAVRYQNAAAAASAADQANAILLRHSILCSLARLGGMGGDQHLNQTDDGSRSHLAYQAQELDEQSAQVRTDASALENEAQEGKRTKRNEIASTKTTATPSENDQERTSPTVEADETKTKSKEDEKQMLIRHEQVEAALKSKPQRGRKRDNLSEMERLELTRTRNREHAKSTRVRKKARYQELLDREQLLTNYRKNEELEQKRKEALMAFICIRERMLRSAAGLDVASDSERTEKASNAVSPTNKQLEDMVECMDSFEFIGSDHPEEDDELGFPSSVKKMDHSIVERIVSRFGSLVIPTLSLRISGGADNIALTSNDGALVEAELSIRADHKNVPLISALLRVKFEPDSDKLSSVKRVLIRNPLFGGNLECLDYQFSHPSVVSLDRSQAQDTDGINEVERHKYRQDRCSNPTGMELGCGKSNEDDTVGPGMDI